MIFHLRIKPTGAERKGMQTTWANRMEKSHTHNIQQENYFVILLIASS
jgi:hypothetical protein